MSAEPHGTAHTDGQASADPARDPRATVLVYSDDVNTREQVRRSIGRRPSSASPWVDWVECATEPAVIERVRSGGLDLLILDGEAAPAGGMGVCLTLKEEVYRCPPVVVLTGRVADGWLASWSRADAAVPHPLDPLQLARVVAGLLTAGGAESSAMESPPTVAG